MAEVVPDQGDIEFGRVAEGPGSGLAEDGVAPFELVQDVLVWTYLLQEGSGLGFGDARLVSSRRSPFASSETTVGCSSKSGA